MMRHQSLEWPLEKKAEKRNMSFSPLWGTCRCRMEAISCRIKDQTDGFKILPFFEEKGGGFDGRGQSSIVMTAACHGRCRALRVKAAFSLYHSTLHAGLTTVTQLQLSLLLYSLKRVRFS